MINKEKCRNEENNHTYLEESIHWVTIINDTRVYWMWMRFVITAGASVGWMGSSNSLPVLNTMQPVTDVLSWCILSGRFAMQSALLRQRILQSVEEPQTSVGMITCLNDFLWGISNFLSAQWLHGKELRPPVGAPGWWGNLCMEALLIYDVIFAAWLFRHEQHQIKDLIMLSHERPIQWPYRKKALLNNLVYSISLVGGFLLFRGFFTQINSTVPPYFGAGLCAVTTVLFRATEWAIMLSKLNNQLCMVPSTIEFQHHQYAFQQTCVGASVSVGLDLILPLYLSMSLDTNNKLWVIALSLTTNILINGIFKRDKASPLSRCAFFAPRQSSRVSPASSEMPEFSLA